MHSHVKTISNLPPLLELSITYVPIGSLKADPKNPRRHSPSKIRKVSRSMLQNNIIVPLMVDSEFNVISGHARLQAALQCGYDTLPVIQISHLSKAQQRAFSIADNRLAELATWDETFLTEQFKLIIEADSNFDLEETGFDLPEIEMMISENADAADHVDSDADELVPMAGTPVSKLGDMWFLDQHRVLCGNSVEPSSFATLMGGKRASAVFTDFPYNVKIAGHVTVKRSSRHADFAMASGEMSPAEFTQFLTQTTGLMAQNSKPGALLYQCMDWRHTSEILSAARSLRLEPINMCVWVKPTPGMGSLYRSQHEIVHVFRNGTTPHRNNIQLGSYGRNRSNVWEYPNPSSFGRGTDEGNLSALHPTVKPVAMIRDAILDCTKQGEIILDPFLGVGSTLISAERCKRHCFGIELEPAYVDATVRRWQVHSGGTARHAVTGKTFDEIAAELPVKSTKG